MRQLIEKMKEQFGKMCSTGKLFRTGVTGDTLYTVYILSFPEGTNPVFRDPESSTHNCNTCKNFVRRYGNIVAFDKDGRLMTIFDVGEVGGPYTEIAQALSTAVRSSKIVDVFFETYDMLNRNLNYEKCHKSQQVFRLGVASNYKQYTKEEADKYGIVSPGEIREFGHMHVDLPRAFVNMDTNVSIESIMGTYRDKWSVFSRAMKEISLDTLLLVEDLINQGSLLDGPAHLHVVMDAIRFKEDYDQIEGYDARDRWCWAMTYNMPERTAKFKNTLIGVLCTELSEGKELNDACQSWNKRVDPANYHKATAPITKKQIEEAAKFVEEGGYTESFSRRLATIDDINVTEIKHIATSDKIAKVSIFDGVKATSTQHKRAQYEGIEEVSIEKFMEDILPKCTGVEALFLNSHEGNLVTMTTTRAEGSKPIFKWDNNYSWNFKGDLAGKSQIKEAVKAQGGKVDGVLRFSIMWAEGDTSDTSDLDAWCMQPTGQQIGFRNKLDPRTGGNLDVDIINPQDRQHKNIVENITWPSLKHMPDGAYKFWVNPYRNSGSKGFKAEIEFNGETFSYEYKQTVRQDVVVAIVHLKNGEFTIEHLLPSENSNKEIWGLETNNFHKVNLVCLSPNHWGENGVGNKHYFFMMDGCKTDANVRGFHNENLLPDLLTHRKVMEVLGATNTISVKPNDKQLSGLGFNATVRDEVIVKIQGTHKRMIKIKF